MNDPFAQIKNDLAFSLLALERTAEVERDARLPRLIAARRRALASLGRRPRPGAGTSPVGIEEIVAAEWRLVQTLAETAATLPRGDATRALLEDIQSEVAESALILTLIQVRRG